MKVYVNRKIIGNIDPMIYGHFIEHFHRQIYGGVYDPSSPFADEDGFRTDVLDAMRNIKVPILRWPGGCFVSSYHWKKAVGDKRTPFFDKAWISTSFWGQEIKTIQTQPIRRQIPSLRRAS